MVAEIEKGGALDAAICEFQPQGLVDADALAARGAKQQRRETINRLTFPPWPGQRFHA
jgi:hypothetical protein